LYWVDTTALTATSGYVGDLEKSVSSLIQFCLDRGGEAVLVIDEFHLLRGAGRYRGSDRDVFEMLKSYVDRDQVVILGSANGYVWQPIIDKDAALRRRFPEYIIEPPNPEDCFTMLQHIKASYLDFKPCYVEVTDEAIRAAIYFTQKWEKDKFLPDKATVLISKTVMYHQFELEKQSSQPSSKMQITAKEIKECLYESLKGRMTKEQQEQFLEDNGKSSSSS
jgi:ATP-dependent Clp protease ATP-binding subunit ClpA